MKKFELEEHSDGLIHICDVGVHRRFFLPEGRGDEFSRQLMKAKNVMVTFEGNKYKCPCCGGDRE